MFMFRGSNIRSQKQSIAISWVGGRQAYMLHHQKHNRIDHKTVKILFVNVFVLKSQRNDIANQFFF